MNGSQQNLSLLKQNLKHIKTFMLGKNNNKQQLIRTQKTEQLYLFLSIFWLRTNIVVLKLFSLSIFYGKWSSSMISKACYKPNTTFFHFHVRFCIEKKKLHKQFIRLVEIPFYVMYFPESAGFIPIWLKNVLSQQNNFRETVKWVIYFGPSQSQS